MGKVNYEEPLVFKIAKLIEGRNYCINDFLRSSDNDIDIYEPVREVYPHSPIANLTILDYTLSLQVNSSKDLPKMKELADIIAEKLNLNINISVEFLE